MSREDHLPPVSVDAFAFGRHRLLGGAPVPWPDVAELAAFHRTLSELLDGTTVTLPLGDLYAAWWDAAPAELVGPDAIARPGGALRAMLAAPQPRAALAPVIDAVAARGPVVLELPAPGAWAAWADQRAGAPAPQDDPLAGRRAAPVVANFLRAFGDSPVTGVLIEGAGAEELAPLAKVADHYRWQLRTPATLDDAFWHGDPPAGDGPWHLRIPAPAEPASILDRLGALRAEVVR
ncbi:MAG TPA: hypothetical protein VD931_11315 [Baekduia sp.]|nr:hypothetical protein [Baekduia sp.]